MNAQAEMQSSKFEILKLSAALALVVMALGAFYYFAEESLLIRVLGLMACTLAGIFIALQTGRGQQVLGFFRESQTEVRKVVWPTRQETVRTTLLVIAMVVVVALFLWLLDLALGWMVQSLTGQRG